MTKTTTKLPAFRIDEVLEKGEDFADDPRLDALPDHIRSKVQFLLREQYYCEGCAYLDKYTRPPSAKEKARRRVAYLEQMIDRALGWNWINADRMKENLQVAKAVFQNTGRHVPDTEGTRWVEMRRRPATTPELRKALKNLAARHQAAQKAEAAERRKAKAKKGDNK